MGLEAHIKAHHVLIWSGPQGLGLDGYIRTTIWKKQNEIFLLSLSPL